MKSILGWFIHSKSSKNALRSSDCKRTKLGRLMSHEVGGALKLIAVY